MKNVQTKKTFAAFEAKLIKPSQQLEVKGGDGEGELPIIGEDDVIVG